MNRVLLPALLLTLGSCIFEVLFLRCRKAERHTASFFLKGLAALCFLGTGAVLFSASHRGFWTVCGLAFGLLGDQLLALRKLFTAHRTHSFAAGALAFSLGHCCYIAALCQTGDALLFPAVPVLVILLAASELFARKSGFARGKMHLPALLYIAVEGVMCAFALVLLRRSPGLFSVLFAAGGICFLISDNLLCAYSFGSMRTAAADRWLHITYIAAQLLIAWSCAVPF